jgi:hypothetical protein
MSFEFTQKMSGEVFRETKSYIILIFPVLFSLRLLYLNMTAANARDYGDLLKGAVLFLALLLSYEYLLSLTFDFSRALEGDMSEHARERILSSEKSPIPTPGLSMIRKTLGLLSSILYYLAQGLFIICPDIYVSPCPDCFSLRHSFIHAVPHQDLLFSHSHRIFLAPDVFRL